MDSSSGLPEIHALWIGERVGPLAVACLESFSICGHSVKLHCYRNLHDIPKGVTPVDANLTIPEDEIFVHNATQSYAVFSDIFRYELLKNGADIYVDCDVFCVRPLEKREYTFGRETDVLLNTAVLGIPRDCQLLKELSDLRKSSHMLWPWEPKKPKLKFKLKNIPKFFANKEKQRTLASKRWGDTGPNALTYLAKKMGHFDKGASIDIYYPVHFTTVSLLFDPHVELSELITSRTKCVHLYNEAIRAHGLSPQNAPRNSPIGQIIWGK